MSVREDIEARFWARVERRFLRWVRKTDTCWLWTGKLPANGYAVFSIENYPYYAHRVAYELWVGPIPEGYQIDHVRAKGCTHRHCVNPAHLEAVEQAENIRRGWRATKLLCPKGHPLVPGATQRICPVCRREGDARRKREARRAA